MRDHTEVENVAAPFVFRAQSPADDDDRILAGDAGERDPSLHGEVGRR